VRLGADGGNGDDESSWQSAITRMKLTISVQNNMQWSIQGLERVQGAGFTNLFRDEDTSVHILNIVEQKY
jgi:hypothetical protein